MDLKQLIKKKVGNNRYKTLFRVKLGKALMVIVALPLGTSILFPLASAMMLPIKPTLWAKDKLREIKIRMMLR